MKVYAKQIAPEYQESYLDLNEDTYKEFITVCGNNDFIGHMTTVFERVWKALCDGELADILKDIAEHGSYYNSCFKNATAAINDLLWREDGKKYSTKTIHELKRLIEKYSTCRSSEENTVLCSVLSLVTGEKYDYRQINGCCQSDWNYIYYPVEKWSKESIEHFEAEYFNTGSEWIIHDEETEPESAEEINGYSVYCVGWNDDLIRKEIAEAEGVNVFEVVLFAYDGSISIPQYRKVS